MLKRIWLIGGTQDSAQLATAIAQAQIPCVATVTTEAARSLYRNNPYVQVWVGALSPETISNFLQTYQVGAVLDASHPFAAEISQLAIATCQHYQIPYLRYERPCIDEAEPETALSSVRTVSRVEQLFETDELANQRVLLTLGYRWLAQFQPWQHRATLFARILPSPTALRAALAAGFTSDRLIALRPPVSADLERALWQQWQISMVITKASGTAGGEAVKRHLAAELGIPLIVIARPAIPYPHQTPDCAAAIAFCQAHGSSLPQPNF